MTSNLKRVGNALATIAVVALIVYQAFSRNLDANTLLFGALVVVAVIGVLLTFFWFGAYISLSVQAYQAGIRVSPIRLFRLKKAGVDPKELVFAAVRLYYAMLDTPFADLEDALRCGRDLRGITNAMLATRSTPDPLSFERARELDRTGRLDGFLESAGVILTDDHPLEEA